MADRSAVDTITGYFYQFDKTIYEILNHADMDAPIGVECIEDIDIESATETTALQCKYYHKTKYEHSVIKKAIQAMVKDFAVRKSTGPLIRYFLYGHYSGGQGKLGTVDLALLKDSFLTTISYSTHATTGVKSASTTRLHDDLTLTDADLLVFLGQLTIDINAPTLEDQYNLIVQLLREAFPSHQTLLESFYYANALTVVKGLTIEQVRAKRQITKRAFIEKINKGERIINALFLARLSREKYVSMIRRDFFSVLNMDPFDRYFLIEIRPGDSILKLRELIYIIFATWSKTSNRHSPKFCPKIYLHGLASTDLAALKMRLYQEGIRFRDGYPFKDSAFTAADFLPEPSASTAVKIDFINNLADLSTILKQAGRKKEIYEFHYDKLYFTTAEHALVPLMVRDISYIEGILK